MSFINLDHNSSHGLLPEVAAALTERIHYLNPNAIHQAGQAARAEIENARQAVADLLGVNKNYKVVFTSGATEANNQAVFWPFQQILAKKLSYTDRAQYGYISSTIEHPCVLEPCRRLAELGFAGSLLTPDSDGKISSQELAAAIQGFQPLLASFMAVNNETAQILEIAEIFSELKKYQPDIICHSDLVQAIGKLDFNFNDYNLDLATISGHKIGALMGVGALIAADQLAVQNYIWGGAQESRYRAGTQNVLGIISFGVAAKVILKSKQERLARLTSLSEFFEARLRAHQPTVIFNNAQLKKTAGVFSVRFAGINAQDLLVALDLNGVLVSAGAACASGKPLPSHVLMALGLSEQAARESLRLSISASQSESDLERAAAIISKCVQQIESSNFNSQQTTNQN